MLCLAALAVGLTGWRPGRAWTLFGGYLVVCVDRRLRLRLRRGAAASPVTGAHRDAVARRGAAAGAVGLARLVRRAGRQRRARARIVIPAVGAVAALGVLVYARRSPARAQSRVAVVIAAVALAVVLVRGWWPSGRTASCSRARATTRSPTR